MGYMPVRSPRVSQRMEKVLTQIGGALRVHRKSLGISAVTAAEAAGMSRVTLHRIEAGSPSVTMGAYANAACALGLELALVPQRQDPVQESTTLPPPREGSVRVGDYPQLKAIAWQVRPDTELSEMDALRTYERNWRHVDQAAMSEAERAFVQHLADVYSRGVLLV